MAFKPCEGFKSIFHLRTSGLLKWCGSWAQNANVSGRDHHQQPSPSRYSQWFPLLFLRQNRALGWFVTVTQFFVGEKRDYRGYHGLPRPHSLSTNQVEIIRQSLSLQCTLGAAALSLGELSLDDGKSVSSMHLALPITLPSVCGGRWCHRKMMSDVKGS